MVLLARGSVTVTAVNDGVPEKLYRAWSNNADGSGFSTTDSSGKYLGTYVGLSEPTLASQYKWTLIKGETGETGQPGVSAYLHTAWANSANGQTGFSTSVSTDKLFIGTYSSSSSTPSQVYTSYKWVRVKGLDAKFYSVIVDKSFLNRNGLSSTATETITINSYVHEGNSAGVAAPGFFIIKEQIKQTTAGVTTYVFQEKHRSTTAVSQLNYTVSANAVTVKIEFYLTNQFNNLFAVRDIGVLMDASTDIQARVPIAQLIENINNHPDTTRISGKRMHFTNEVSFDQSFHTKLFAETGFIENLSAYEFSADNIKTGTLSSANGMSTMNLTTGAFSFAGGKLKYDGTTLSVIGSLTVESFAPALKTSFDGKVDTSKLKTSGQVVIHGGNITAGTLSADKITTGTLDASLVTVTNLTATNITAGTLDVGKLTLKNLSASDMQTGILNAGDVDVINLSASVIKTGTLDANVVNVINLNASAIKTGTLDAGLVNIDNLSANSIKGGSLDLSQGLTISDGVNDILSIGTDGKVALNASSIKIGLLPVATKKDVDEIALTPGPQGTSITSVTEWYLATSAATGVTTSTAGWDKTMRTMTTTNKYLWNYKVINYSQGTPQTTAPVIIGVYGTTGATGRSITSVTKHYLATSASSGIVRTNSSFTQTIQSTTPTDKYLWTYETITWNVAPLTTYVEPFIIGTHGDKGEVGPKGATGSQGPKGDTGTSVSSVTEHYLATSASTGVTTATGGWTTAVQGMTSTNKYLWNYEQINFSDGTIQPTIPVIIGVYGDTGEKGGTGATGATGRSITSITEHYLTTSANSGVTRATSGWSTSMQTTSPINKYLWNYETITWSSGTTTTYVEPIIVGIHGEQGIQGPKGDTGPQGATGSQGPRGATGTSVDSVTEYYLATSVSSGILSTNAGFTTTIQTMTPTNKYLWNYEKINFSDGTDQPTIPVIIGVYGDKGTTGGTGPTGETGRSITGITEHYLASTLATGVTRATSGWSTTMQPTTPTNKYLWNYETITWSSGTTTTYVEPIIIGIHGEQGPKGDTGPQGATGSQGPKGDTGTSVSSVTEYYLATPSSSGVTTATVGWTTTIQTMTATNKYLWNYEKINFSDGTSPPTIPVIIGVYGDKGQTGSTGSTGATGRSITAIQENYLATSAATGVTRSTAGWSTTMQTTTPTNKYLWNYEIITWSSGTITTYVEPIIIGIHGEQGPQGIQGPKGATGSQGPQGNIGVGVASITEKYLATTASSGVTTATSGWTTSIQPLTTTNKYLWNYETINFSDGSNQPTIPVIIGVYGDKGETGGTGATGRSITAITEHYLATAVASGVTRATSGWSTTMQPTTPTNKYLWNYETITWSSGTTTTYVEPIIIGVHGDKGETGATGAKGATGEQGPQGAAGVSVSTITEYYLATASASGVTTATAGWTTTMQPMDTTKKYLWNYELITFSDNSTQPTLPVVIGVHGATGAAGGTGSTGATGRSITGITENYLATSAASGVTRATAGWTTTMQTTTTTNKYLWNYETITWSSGTTTTYVEPIIIGIHGETGSTGATGAQGVSITKVDVQYYLSTSNASLAGGSWSTTAPAWVDGQYMWSKTVTTYTSGLPTESLPVCITGAKGSTGATGQNALSAILTNESISLPADSAGTVTSFTGATGMMNVYDGTTNLTTGVTYAKVSETGIVVTLNTSTGAYTVTSMTGGTTVKTGSVIIRATYAGNTIEKQLNVSKAFAGTAGAPGTPGGTGAPGANAQLITLSASGQIFKKPKVGAVTPATLAVTGTAQNTTIATWQYSTDGGAFTTTLPTGVGRSGNIVTLTGATMTARTIAIKAFNGSIEDVMTIATVEDGIDGLPGGNGAPGQNAISALLTNESISLPADSAGTVSSYVGATGMMNVYDGTTNVASGVVYSKLNESGITTTINASTGAYTISAMTAGVAVKTGSVTLRAVYAGQTLDKQLNVAKAFAGTAGGTGSTGAPGAPGANAQLITLTASGQIFTKPKVGAVTPATIAVTGTAQNITITGWQYSTNGAAFTTTLPTGVTRTGNVVTLTGATMTAKTIAVKMLNGAVEDVITIAKVEDGTDGLPGSNGSNGATGRGITSIVEQFYLSDSKMTQTGGAWSTTMPTWSVGKYVWTRSYITYTTGTPATDTTTPLVSSEWEAINEIDIGGTNLLQNSRTVAISSNDTSLYPTSITAMEEDNRNFSRIKRTDLTLSPTTFSIYSTIPIENINKSIFDNELTVVSFKARASQNVTMSTMQATYGGSPIVTGNLGNINVTTEWKTFYSIFTKIPKSASGFRVNPTANTTSVTMSTFYLDLCEWKIEKGNKPTDWSPAPEDVKSDIDSKADSKETAEQIEQARKDLIASQEKEVAELKAQIKTLDAQRASLETARQNDMNAVATQFVSALGRVSAVETNLGDQSADWNFINTNIKMSDEGLMIGDAQKGNYLLQQSNRLDFISNGTVVAYVSNNELWIESGVFTDKLTIGGIAIRKNGADRIRFE